MERVAIVNILKKYRYVLFAAVLGIALMLSPGYDSEQETTTERTNPQPDEKLEDALAEILSNVYGAGSVEVLLTQKEGEKTIYQNDESINDLDIRKSTVLVTKADRTEAGLIKQIDPPVYQGAVIVCQGADDPQIRLALVKAMISATGLSSDRITVLKMK